MAVTKMEKVTLISDKRNQDAILQAVQGIQNVEIRDLFQETSNNQWVDTYFPKVAIFEKEPLVNALKNRILQTREAIQFIEHHGDKQQKKQHLKRQELTLQELAENYSEEDFTKKLEEILSLKKQWETLTEQRNELASEEEWLVHWYGLDVSPKHAVSKETDLVIGSINVANYPDFSEEIQKINGVYLEEVSSNEHFVYLSYVSLKSMRPSIEEVTGRYGFVKEDYPYDTPPKEQLQKIKNKLTNCQEEQKKLAVKIGNCSNYIQELQWAEENLLAMSEREAVKDRFIHAPYLIVVQGWIGEEEKQELNQQLSKSLSAEDIFISFEEPTDEEIKGEVPTKLKNHPLVAPFEMLTEMYSLPKYQEIDPTPWMMPFYLVFFGMMVADIGYGLLMLIGAIAAQKLMVLPRGMKQFAKFFEILAFPSIIWGFIYSSFFGQALPKEVFGIHLPFPILSTTEDVNTILILSVIFGLIQILVGLFIAAKEHIKHKAYVDAVNDGFAWQGILVGLILILIGAMLIKNDALVYLGAGLAILSALCILIIPIFQSSSKIKGIAKGAYSLYGLTGYIGDLVSYTRLMALGISGGSIAAAFNMLVAFMPPAARFSIGILLIIALHALNMFLTLLSAYVHGARLQYVEFFGKFYTGGGRAFKPLKTAEKYVNINHKKK
ncbi:V-type sodium ATPase subunit I [Enterococcus sp. 10A9_DIV0425]|uniref:V-type sodium ATPase subunit I n=1 Tax=Candidatus Enterococcus wittei TaxID=1987383 RepID=A0A242JY41_9ENTE|nr:V-type ATP synthase subunit I [Enterococcus sp. 10A9_DIV0425]OTP10039.1 V-type sodium ATPase subunit I [Enterococcus sp. 10A9_DIV0425]